MSRIELVESEIQKLTSEELAQFRAWFAEYEADQWDLQIEADAKAGKFDKLAERAILDHKAGMSTRLPLPASKQNVR